MEIKNKQKKNPTYLQSKAEERQEKNGKEIKNAYED